MTGGDQREPLWASSLADQPQRTLDPVPEPEAPHEAPGRTRPHEAPERPRPHVAPGRPRAEPPAGQQGLALGLLAAIAVVAVAMAAATRGPVTVADVPSAWGNTRMTCHTVRFEQDGSAFELFHCRAVGAGRLPPGLYRSPDAQWTSDLTRVDARVNVIRISRDGELTGWAAYR